MTTFGPNIFSAFHMHSAFCKSDGSGFSAGLGAGVELEDPCPQYISVAE